MAGSAYGCWPDFARASVRSGYQRDIKLKPSLEDIPPHAALLKYPFADSRLRELAAANEERVRGVFKYIKTKREKFAEVAGEGVKVAEWWDWWSDIEYALMNLIREQSVRNAQIVATENGLYSIQNGRSKHLEEDRKAGIAAIMRVLPESEEDAVAAAVSMIYIESRHLVLSSIVKMIARSFKR